MTASNLLATAQVSHSIEYSSGTGQRLDWMYQIAHPFSLTY